MLAAYMHIQNTRRNSADARHTLGIPQAYTSAQVPKDRMARVELYPPSPNPNPNPTPNPNQVPKDRMARVELYPPYTKILLYAWTTALQPYP